MSYPCSGCHACFSICPQNCIEMLADNEGFLYPEIDEARCTRCGLCRKICPVRNVKLESKTLPSAYAAYSLDEELLEKSSSGGIFTLIAEQVLDQGGVIFGAGFDERFNVVHSFAENKENLGRFRGSKYVQSTIASSYKQAKGFLDKGRQVLFTGTPCQVGGLKAFLDKDYDYLFTQDLICHGVPSPKVWRGYVDFREKHAGSPVKKVSFRRGWKRYSVSFLFKNDTEYLEPQEKEPYIRLFFHDICLRPSCYNCAFKTLHRQADITLADFWGIEKVLPEMYNGEGVSLVMTHGKKGEMLFDRVKPKVRWMKTDVYGAIKYNKQNAMRSKKLHTKRKVFFENIKSKSLEELADLYCKKGLIECLRARLKLRTRIRALLGFCKDGKS